MKTLKLDTGIVSYKLGQGVLRFNPTDPNVYMRFQSALEVLEQLEKALPEQLQQQNVLQVMTDVDAQLKKTLNDVFGPGNDFDTICGGVNLLAADGQGVRLITRLFAALEPVLLEGARQCARAADSE